jgi:DNA-binding GntR family transcriptional regulator
VSAFDLVEARTSRPDFARGGGFLYERVVDFIERLIETQHLAAGDRLPTQAKLGELTGVSRITVTRALETLERQGRIHRHQGLGTFIAGQRIVSESARLGGLLTTLSEAAPALSTKITALELGHASADLCEALKVTRTEAVWRLRRQRTLGLRPIILETSVLPFRLVPDLDRHVATLTSLYDLLETVYGLRDENEQQLLDIVAPGLHERRQLGLRTRDLVARIRGVSIDSRGAPFDAFEQLYPTGEFAFSYSTSGLQPLLAQPDLGNWSFHANAPNVQPKTRSAAAESGGRTRKPAAAPPAAPGRRPGMLP